MINVINTLLFEFLWDSKTDKVKRSVVIKELSDGGLKMINLKAFINSLKLGWIKRINASEGKWKSILKENINIELLFNVGGEYVLKCASICKNPFWKDVFNTWYNLWNSKTTEKVLKESFLTKCIWHNKDITIAGKPVFYKTWYESGISIVADLVKNINDFSFYTFEELTQNYRLNSNFLQVQGLIRAVQGCLPNPFPQQIYPVIRPFVPRNMHILLKSLSDKKLFYKIFNSVHSVPTGKLKWEQQDVMLEDWNNIYKLPYKVTKNTKLQWLQFRILHYILTTNSNLCKFGIVNSPMCTLCNSERETIIHLMWECQEVQDLIQNFESLISALYIPFAVNKYSFIFGLINNNINSDVDNVIILLMKQYIYRARCLSQSLSINSLVQNIKEYYNLQKYIANGQSEYLKGQFLITWRKWIKLIQLDI